MLNLGIVPILDFVAFRFRARYFDEPVTLLQELVNAFKTQPERLSDRLSAGNYAKLALCSRLS